MRVVILGAPGAGKGTQTKYLESRYRLPQVSTGDILRQAVREQRPLGQSALAYMSKGELVPDELMLDLIRERLARPDCQVGFVLDGFPRTIAQAEGLQQLLGGGLGCGCGLDAALFIRVPRELIVQRLSGRRACKCCGNLYHTTFVPPVEEGVCDRCGGELYQREDDREEMISARLDVFEKQTAPVVEYYRRRQVLSEVDGVGGVEEVRDRILTALGLKSQ